MTRSSRPRRRSNGSISKASGGQPARFDLKKLDSLNGHYIRETDDAALTLELVAFAERLKPELSLDAATRARLTAAMPLLKTRAKTLVELVDKARIPVRRRSPRPGRRSRSGPDAGRRARSSAGSQVALDSEPLGRRRRSKRRVRALAEQEGAKLGDVAQPLRVALTGRTASPPIFEVLARLGPRRGIDSHPRPCRLRWSVHRSAHALLGARRLVAQAMGPLRRTAQYSWSSAMSRDESEPSQPDRQPSPTATSDWNCRFSRHGGSQCRGHPQALRRGRPLHLRSRLHLHGVLRERTSPSSTATRACCSIAAIPSTSWPSIPASWRSATSCSTANCRRRKQMEDFDHTITYHTMVHEQLELPVPRLPPRRASDGGHGRRGRRAVGLLSRLHRHHRQAPARSRQPPPDREDADHRGHGLQIFDRPALRVSAEPSRLHRELHAHVLRGAVRGVQAQSGAGQGARHHLHPARRSRAERVDLDRAPRRLVGRQPVRLHRGGHRLSVGSGAWRRQRSGAEDAAGDRHRRPRARIREARQGQERSASA